MKQLCCVCYNVDMKYDVTSDVKFISACIPISFSQLADSLNVARSTIMRIVYGEINPSIDFLERLYSFAYNNDYRTIDVNYLKVSFAYEYFEKILFHGTTSDIEGEIDLKHSRTDIDVGRGFYLGESYEQAASYIFGSKKSSVFMFDASKLDGLKVKEFDVSLEWMLMVSYYRGQLNEYKDSKMIRDIIDEVESVDVVIAPIADNNMYEIMNSFARGSITDVQASKALSASHLGKQYVLKSNKACKRVMPFERLYLCKLERERIEEKRKEASLKSKDESKKAIESLRRQGRYIEEILK